MIEDLEPSLADPAACGHPDKGVPILDVVFGHIRLVAEHEQCRVGFKIALLAPNSRRHKHAFALSQHQGLAVLAIEENGLDPPADTDLELISAVMRMAAA